MNLDLLQSFLGWCLVINYAVLIVWFGVYSLANQWITGLHGRMFDLDAETVRNTHFHLMGQFKLLVFIFFLAPWLALVIMGN